MKLLKACAVLSCSLAPVVAQAQGATDGPEGVAMGGGWFLKPVLDASYLYDSNLYRQQDDETSASAFVISPAVALEYLTSDNVVRAGYQGEFANYDTDGADDYGHSDLLFDARVNQTGRHRLAVNLARNEGHDPFGTERTELVPATQRDLDEWVLTSGRLAYTFGAPSAFLNVTGSLEGASKQYQNNRGGTRFLDRDSFGGGLETRFRISPRTGLLFDVHHREIQYDEVRAGFSPRDGAEQRARVGMQWFASAKLVGRVLVGGLRREFDADDREDFTSFDWDLAISWRPTTYSELVLEGGHSTQESYFDQSDFIDVNRVGGRWTHQWNSRIETGLAAFLTRYDFEGFERSDDVMSTVVYGQYEFTRNLKARLSFEPMNRESDQPARDFDRHVTQLRLQFAL